MPPVTRKEAETRPQSFSEVIFDRLKHQQFTVIIMFGLMLWQQRWHEHSMTQQREDMQQRILRLYEEKEDVHEEYEKIVTDDRADCEETNARLVMRIQEIAESADREKTELHERLLECAAQGVVK